MRMSNDLKDHLVLLSDGLVDSPSRLWLAISFSQSVWKF